MGLFLAQPLAQELALAVAPTSPLAHARRLLTLLVPLAYRPCMKVGDPPALRHADLASPSDLSSKALPSRRRQRL